MIPESHNDMTVNSGATGVLGRIASLDMTLFAAIPTQTSDEDKTALLAVQRAVAVRHGRYSYLEIGSHLGGSIQPHLVDPRCEVVYSIDPRPENQPDDAFDGHVIFYEGNSTGRMLKLLE